MLKTFFIIVFLSLLLPFSVHAQNPESQATSSTQFRNRLQLLQSPKIADSSYKQLDKRFDALLNRLTIINAKIGKRISKLIAAKAVVNKLNNTLDSLNTDIKTHEKEKNFILEDWNNLIAGNTPDLYPAFKKRINAFFVSLDSLVIDEKNLINEIKKYKSVAEPTQKEATASDSTKL